MEKEKEKEKTKSDFEFMNFVMFCRFDCVSFVEYRGRYHSLDQRRRLVLQLNYRPIIV